MMRYRFAATLGILSVALAASVLFHENAAAEAEPADEQEIKRGEYLVTIGGCNDCHTPKTMTDQGPLNVERHLLSGYLEGKEVPPVPRGVIGPGRWGGIASEDLTAWVGPWGISFAANLTPDETGMDSWTAEQFILAMRTGRSKGVGRPILPPMPWYGLAPMPDEDLRAIFAYLKSLAPVKNKVPDPVPPEAVHYADE
jgi:mono/diheme cytochrome c family protein